MTTVACVWMKGHVPYPVRYVERLAAMVRKHMDRPYRFVCLTDRPALVPKGVEPIAIPNPRPLFAWWAKVSLFDASLPLTGRVLYLDLDTVIARPLAPILDYAAPFALIPHTGRFEGKNGLAVVKRFNSSVMVWNAGEQRALFDDWTPDVAQRLHGDQDWIGERNPNAAAMNIEWFPRLSELNGQPPSFDAKVVLAKTPKNEQAAKLYPWFNAIWRAA